MTALRSGRHLMYHWSAKPPFFCNACCESSAPVSFSGPPSWKLAASCTLVAWSACNRCSSDGSSTPIHGRLPAACYVATRRRVSAATISKGQAALQAGGGVDVSLLCTSILRRWREPCLFNMRQISMFPCCCCRVFGEKPRTPPRALPATRSSQKQFFSSTL